MTIDAAKGYEYIDTAIGGVGRRNNVMSRAEFNRKIAEASDPTDCFATYLAFTPDFVEYARTNPSPTTGQPPSVARYPGPAYANFLPIDVDCESDLEQALADTRKIVGHLSTRWNIATPRVWFSGAKGFSIHVSGELFGGFEPSNDIAERLDRLVERLFEGVDVRTLDMVIYEKLRLWRIPNTRHSKSGLFKIPISIGELFTLDADAIRALAVSPRRAP